jgi:hypothetical protein
VNQGLAIKTLIISAATRQIHKSRPSCRNHILGKL